jgi:DNA-binding transcriptional MerR regulator
MIMTQNRVLKAAIRRRVAETGESYVVARRAVLAESAAHPESAGVAGAAGMLADELTPEQQYVREATAAGVSAAEIDAALAAFRQADLGEPGGGFGRAGSEQASMKQASMKQASTERASMVADQLVAAAERAREQADQAEEAANEAEEQAVAAEERADLATDAAEEAADDETGWAEAEDDGSRTWDDRAGEPRVGAGRAGFRPGGRDSGSVWAEATRAGSGADAVGRGWGEAPPPPVPPIPPVPPAPPAPPVPPAPPGPWR